MRMTFLGTSIYKRYGMDMTDNQRETGGRIRSAGRVSDRCFAAVSMSCLTGLGGEWKAGKVGRRLVVQGSNQGEEGMFKESR